ncbi:hypothetical protein Aazo_0657 ['Nostoc azollae' 0708]|uniref:Uncharacterized protein n=1 Tax=Nostoc azollae (strain 0708) TaxID=551115 RepID=D7E0Z6_NOSA0|nr:hypothetical protein Aazo_0657 ['Nostoc azollae' 0708]
MIMLAVTNSVWDLGAWGKSIVSSDSVPYRKQATLSVP